MSLAVNVSVSSPIISMNDASYRAVVAALDDLFLVVDEAGRLVEWNSALVDASGHTAAALTDRSVATLFAAVDGRSVDDAITTARETGTATVQADLQPATGAAIPYEIEWTAVPAIDVGGEGTVAGVGREITARRARDRKLQRLQRRTRQLMTTDTITRTAQLAVDTAHEVLDADLSGFHRRTETGDRLELVARTDTVTETFDELPGYDRDADDPVAAFVWEAFERGESYLVDDTDDHPRLAGHTPAGSGGIYPIGEYGVLIVSSTEHGAFDHTDQSLIEILAATLRTALERVDRQSLLRERERSLEQQVERLDRFASIVSHDLRNPLNIAQGRVDLVRSEYDGDPEAVLDHLDAAAAAHDRMNALIESLLTLARSGRAVEDREPVALATVAERCWTLAGGADGGATLRIDTDRRLMADACRLKQLLENLFDNAIERGDADTVTVGTLTDPPGFYVADDGCGVPAADREQVFESGYSSTASGTGFGLSIVEEIATAHGWTVTLTESAASGARFEVTGIEMVDADPDGDADISPDVDADPESHSL